MNTHKKLLFALRTLLLLSFIMTSLIFYLGHLQQITKDVDMILTLPYYTCFTVFFDVLIFFLSVLLFIIVCLFKEVTFYDFVLFLIVSIMFVFMCLLPL